MFLGFFWCGGNLSSSFAFFFPFFSLVKTSSPFVLLLQSLLLPRGAAREAGKEPAPPPLPPLLELERRHERAMKKVELLSRRKKALELELGPRLQLASDGSLLSSPI